jgi:hypothetical protein
MRSVDLQSRLLAWSLANSGNDEHRNYIGLSGIADCERVIIERWRGGNHPEDAELLKFGLGYDMEHILIGRLKALGLYRAGPAISLYGGMVQGHTDGLTPDGDLIEIKSVPGAQHLPVNGKLPRRVYWQVQAYLYFGRLRYAHVIYLARDTGALAVYGLRLSPEVGHEIEAKVARLVEFARSGRTPACTCGRCVLTAAGLPVAAEEGEA